MPYFINNWYNELEGNKMSLSDNVYIEIPGSRETKFELPPLCLSTERINSVDIIEKAEQMVESDCLFDQSRLLDENFYDRSRRELALNLIDRYSIFLQKWDTGNSVLEWIENCKCSFEFNLCLKNILNPNLWPHAGKNSFIKLLEDKGISDDVRNDVGCRLMFRKKPPINILTPDFLLFLSSESARITFERWEDRIPKPVASLPPERFSLQVIKM